MIAIGDAVRFKADFRSPWRFGYVAEIDGRRVVIRPQGGGRTVAIVRGHKGQIEELDAQGLVDAELPRGPLVPSEIARRVLGIAPPLRLVRVDGTPRPVAQRRPPIRSGAYRAFVRTQPCAGDPQHAGRPAEAHHQRLDDRRVGERCDDLLCVALCRACHRHLTDHHVLPGRSAEETRLHLLEEQVRLLVEWHALLMTAIVGQTLPDPESLSPEERALSAELDALGDTRAVV